MRRLRGLAAPDTPESKLPAYAGSFDMGKTLVFPKPFSASLALIFCRFAARAGALPPHPQSGRCPDTLPKGLSPFGNPVPRFAR